MQARAAPGDVTLDALTVGPLSGKLADLKTSGRDQVLRRAPLSNGAPVGAHLATACELLDRGTKAILTGQFCWDHAFGIAAP